jgi:hypothetical protein
MNTGLHTPKPTHLGQSLACFYCHLGSFVLCFYVLVYVISCHFTLFYNILEIFPLFINSLCYVALSYDIFYDLLICSIF